MIKMREIRNLTLPEIQQRFREAVEELNNLRIQLATHQLDDTSKVKHARHAVARLKTVLHEIELKKRQPLLSQQKKEEAIHEN
jgi:large subunit ribosomal protein L29